MKYLSKKITIALMAAGLSFSSVAANIKIAYDSDPVSLDPQEQLSGGTLQMSHLLFDPLVRLTQDMQFEPRLATSWERVNDHTFRFHLRQGVTFHSGNPMTADDVVWTFKRLQGSPDFKGIFEPYVGMKKVDEYTVDLISKGPYPLVLQNATYIFVMDKKFYSGKTKDGKDKSAIIKNVGSFASANESGTGPFIITHRDQGIKDVFTRYKSYWDHSSKGNVDEITLLPIANEASRYLALKTGDVDMIAPVSPNEFRNIRSSKGLQLVTMAGTRSLTFQMNQHSNPALKNQKVREAIIYAINNELIVKKLLRGFATVAGQQSPKGYAGYDPALVPRYNLKKAKELMKEAGYPDGFTLTMMAPNNRYLNDEKVAQATKSMLGKIGIRVELKTMPKAQYWPEFDKCAADMMMIGWSSDTNDSANFVQFLEMTRDPKTGAGQYNCGYYSNPQVDKLIIASNSEIDPNKRGKMLQEAETILYKDAAFVPLYYNNLAWAAKTSLHIKPVVNAINMPYLGDLVVDQKSS
ncbi:ABC transporter substrate-binding protein [Dongshaea marina]|uniref:ABC transporter substrate-binding protein n=1 Tax=Dongshaea marina TaxID=2047966 RepID=UPI000D3EB66F